MPPIRMRLPIDRPEARIADDHAEVTRQTIGEPRYLELRPSDLVALRMRQLLVFDLDGITVFLGYQGDGE